MEAQRSMTRRDEALDFCRIERWRGYVSSAFYASAGDDVVHLSETFRWRRKDSPPDEGAARAAYDTVVAQLEADGWTQHSVGSVWHQTTFSRPAPSRSVQEPVVEAPAVERPIEQPPAVVAAPPPRVRTERAEPAPPPAPPPPRQRRRGRIAIVAAVLAVAAAGVAAAIARTGGAPPARHPATAHRAHAAAKPKHRHAAPAAPRTVESVAKAPATATVDVVIAADRGSSWVEIRRGSSTGKVLFAAELAQGKRLHYRAPRLWARFGAAANLAITVDGKSLALQGTFDKVFHA
jgi:uncharacterized protein DUF4115